MGWGKNLFVCGNFFFIIVLLSGVQRSCISSRMDPHVRVAVRSHCICRQHRTNGFHVRLALEASSSDGLPTGVKAL